MKKILEFLSRIYVTKEWRVELAFRKFEVKNIPITVRFTVNRRVNKWFWNFIKTDTIYFCNNYTDSKRKFISTIFGPKEGRKLQLQIEIEMLKLKIKHLR